jgi:hypothetical protein
VVQSSGRKPPKGTARKAAKRTAAAAAASTQQTDAFAMPTAPADIARVAPVLAPAVRKPADSATELRLRLDPALLRRIASAASELKQTPEEFVVALLRDRFGNGKTEWTVPQVCRMLRQELESYFAGGT